MGSQSSKALNLQITLNLKTAVQGLLLKRISNGFREMCLWIIVRQLNNSKTESKY